MTLDYHGVKAINREIHTRAVQQGELRQPINMADGPSAKFMRGFYKRHKELSRRSAERVDRERINMASKDTIKQYFNLLKELFVKHAIIEVDDAQNPIQSSIKRHCIYLADETGWGVQAKHKTVIGRKGSKYVYLRKSNDESHKTLMLGVCGNDVLKPLIILEKSFPLIGEGEASNIPQNMMLTKTEKGSVEQELFCEWLQQAVITHKESVNPDGVSVLIIDNHGSRFNTRAIDLCKENKIEMFCYPGHLTHILQGPDVVLNKPISTFVDRMLHNNALISGNSDLTRIAFMAIVDESVKAACTEEAVSKAFSANGIVPFNPDQIDFPIGFCWWCGRTIANKSNML